MGRSPKLATRMPKISAVY
ncbi:unnamed protein product [Calypogeia fissa]